jgi:SAM-dependent methyltransferase
MNRLIPQVTVEWAEKFYTASMPMKVQAEVFPRWAEALAEGGCEIEVHGDGLLPAMWKIEPITEREKYQKLWTRGDYRKWSPGEDMVDRFLEIASPDGPITDFGCGTGRAAMKMVEHGHKVFLVDFTDNCRDFNALHLPFVQWDLTKPGLPIRSPYGYCTDVMEHIPTEAVEAAIRNIMACSERAFFQIATTPDKFGAVIGQKLHLTVQPHEWWADKFNGHRIEWQERTALHSCFYVTRGAADAPR